MLRPHIIWSHDTSLEKKKLFACFFMLVIFWRVCPENLQSCENRLLYEQKIQQVVIMSPGIASGPGIYVFILMHFYPLCWGLFSLHEILLSLYWHQFLINYVFICHDFIADRYRSSPNLTKILLCQDFQILQRILLINLLLSKWRFAGHIRNTFFMHLVNI